MVRTKLWRTKVRAYESVAPYAARIAERMSATTMATLEYPFIPSARWGWGRPGHRDLQDILAAGDEHYAEIMGRIKRRAADFDDIPRSPGPGVFGWDNGYLPGLDALRLYDALLERRPALYLEVGSGFSTLFVRRAIDRNGLATRIESIDPSPRADVDSSCDVVHRQGLGEVDQSVFEQLQAGDMVFVDGSHTAFMGSDSVIALLEVVNSLPAGVLVGIHDIFLPWDYPPEWSQRWYGEQYLVAAFLLGGASRGDSPWAVDFASFYVSRLTGLTGGDHPLWDVVGDPPGRVGSGLWLERRPTFL
jgi:hypothetical protein